MFIIQKKKSENECLSLKKNLVMRLLLLCFSKG